MSLPHHVFWLVMSGCGRIAFDPVDDAIAVRDLLPDTIGLGPFGVAAPVADINSALDDDDPTLSPDQLELWFDSERAGAPGDIYVAHRASPSSAWMTPTVVPELATAGADEDGPEISSDGLTLYFSSTRAGGAGVDDIWTSTRPTLTDP